MCLSVFLSVCPSIFSEMVGPTLLKLGGRMQVDPIKIKFMFVWGPRSTRSGIRRVKGHVKFQVAPIGPKLVEKKPGHDGNM